MTMKKIVLCVVGLAVSVAAIAQQSDRELFSEAERRFLSQDYELAIDRYDTLIREHPVSQHIPDAQFRKAVALYRLDRPEQALELLNLVERRYRSTRYLGYVPFWRGVIHYDLGRPEEAMTALAAFLDSETGRDDPSGADPDLLNQAYLYKALAEIETGDRTSAISSLSALIGDEATPADQPYALSLLLSLLVQAGEFDRAQALFNSVEIESLSPADRSRVSLYGAEALNGKGEYESAAQAYRSLLGTTPEVATVAYQRLFQYAQAGRIAESSADVLRQAEQALAGQTDILKELWLRVGIDSFNQSRYDLAELYFRRIWDFRRTESIPAAVPLYLSRLLDRRGDIEEAADVLTEFLQIEGEQSDERLRVLIALGNFQIRTGQGDDAVLTLSNAVADYPQSPYFGEASYQYAYALRAVGRSSEALNVISTAFTSGRTSGVQADLIRLRGRILREQGREEDALQALFEYLPLRPDDALAAVEYANLLFALERYGRVLREVPGLLAGLEERGIAGTPERVQLHYVTGLSYVSAKDYESAVAELSAVLRESGSDAEVVALLVPYATYYRGWSLYRQGQYRAAARDFERLIDQTPDHPFAARANYLAGWSYFRLGDYPTATVSLARVRSYPVDESLATEASYLLGRSLTAEGSYQQAAAEFRSLYLDYPDSDYADDAWFEYGQVQALIGNTDAAVAAFDELRSEYPDSPLAEDATFRKAELYFGARSYDRARDAFFDYRTLYPGGRQIDAALYWGGESSAELGETAGALLLWGRLTSEHPASPFRADAIREAAALHAERGEYRQALNLYTELLAAYEEVATAIGAERRINELVLLIGGLSEREAELYVTIEESGGAQSDTGRQAIIELSRLAIYEDTATQIDAATVVPFLESVAEVSNVAPAYAAQALFLLGEYYSRSREFLTAADRYLQAAANSSSDRDLAALAIYRAAEMYSTAGRTMEMQALLQRLEEEFPGSQWLEEARDLLGDAR
jgi:TolA-binding protein/lipopolysaccharide biosynthesis regulator YciM